MNEINLFKIITGYGDCKQRRVEAGTAFNFKVLKVYPSKEDSMKDMFLCEHVPLGYKECFYRMDMGGINYDKQ